MPMRMLFVKKDKPRERASAIELPTSASPAATADDTASPARDERADPNEWTELGKTIALALVLALAIRTFLFEPFNIPSGSMMPNLLIGDYLFVSKRHYGYSQYSFPFGIGPIKDRAFVANTPARGDIVVFKKPSDNRTDFIKRVIGLPGDRIQMVNGRLFINGSIVPRDPVGYREADEGYGFTNVLIEYTETLPNGVQHRIYEQDDQQELDNTDVFMVPDDMVFVMGDNRDNSRDSRATEIGMVPFKNFVGRAEILFFSVDGSAALHEVWKWPLAIRYDRIFKSLVPTQADAP